MADNIVINIDRAADAATAARSISTNFAEVGTPQAPFKYLQCAHISRGSADDFT